MSLAFITYTSPEGVKGVFAEEFTHEAISALPFVRKYGCLPSGYHAVYLEDGEIERGSPRVDELRKLPTWGAVFGSADVRRYFEIQEMQAVRRSICAAGGHKLYDGLLPGTRACRCGEVRHSAK